MNRHALDNQVSRLRKNPNASARRRPTVTLTRPPGPHELTFRKHTNSFRHDFENFVISPCELNSQRAGYWNRGGSENRQGLLSGTGGFISGVSIAEGPPAERFSEYQGSFLWF